MTVLGDVAGLVGMTGIVWVAFVVVWITGFALFLAVDAVMIVGVGGMVVVIAVVVVGVTVAAIIVVIGPDGASSLYSQPLILSCMPCTCFLFVCLAILPHKNKKAQCHKPVTATWTPSCRDYDHDSRAWA